jgi:excisionase family DNA binding protein
MSRTSTIIDGDELLLVDEIARLQKNCPESVRRQIRRGELPAVRVGRQYRIWKSEFLKTRRAST